MANKKYLKDALKIEEVKYQLKNISFDDNRVIESYTQEEIKKEIEWCLYSLQTDLDETVEDEIEAIKKIKKSIKGCEKWLDMYSK